MKDSIIEYMKINVGVFFGGKSTEHEISCISANQVINALDKKKYKVLPIYISKNNEFYCGDKLLDLANYSSFISNPEAHLTKVTIYKEGNRVVVKPTKHTIIDKKVGYIDVAFPVVHGTNVEDGTLAGFIQMLDIPFTSCDVLGGAIGQDKVIMKDIFKAEGVPMVNYFVVNGFDFEEKYNDYSKKATKIGFPLIAKPANLGSSIGIEVIKNKTEFKEKISNCLTYDFKVVVEKMISRLKEVNISVIGGVNGSQVSVIEEVTNGFLDYDKKYLGGSKGSKKMPTKNPSKTSASKGMASTSRKIPANITKAQKKTIEETALKVFNVLNANGCVRIDFMIDKKTGKVYCNEINTIPGSLAFYLWKENGIEFDQECELLIQNALRRFAKRENITYSFDTNILDNYRRN